MSSSLNKPEPNKAHFTEESSGMPVDPDSRIIASNTEPETSKPPGGQKPTGTNLRESTATNVGEIVSDGSASAFEGTESIDSHDQDITVRRKNEQLKNDPSGRSNY
jgi:hypothetical protein